MKIGVLAPVAWRVPPKDYGPWELVAYNMTEGLVKKGHEVTLFATKDSKTSARLESIVSHPYRRHKKEMQADVWQVLHIGHFFEKANQFDILHNHYDFIPLTYSRLVKPPMVTTIHGFSSKKILPVFQEYNEDNYYVSISDADRDPSLDYEGTVYNGINLSELTFNDKPKDYMIFLGRIAKDKGTELAIEVAKKTKRKLIIAGMVPPEEKEYFEKEVEPQIDGKLVEFVGPADPPMRDKLFREAYCTLHMIQFDEPFGLIMTESMATGTPVIAIERGSVSEVVEDGVSGYKVKDVNEAVANVDKIGQIKREDCRKWVEGKFTNEKMVEGYEKIYNKILEKHEKNQT